MLLADSLAARKPHLAEDRKAIGVAYYCAKQQLERSTHAVKAPKCIGNVSLADWKDMIADAEAWLERAGTDKAEHVKFKECACESYLRGKVDGMKVETPPPAAASPPPASPPPASPPPAANPPGKRAVEATVEESAQNKKKQRKRPAPEPKKHKERPAVRSSVSSLCFAHYHSALLW